MAAVTTEKGSTVSTDDGLLDPSPFDPDALPRGRRSRRTGEPELPLTQEDLDRLMAKPYWDRMINPWLCMWNLRADDGIGDYQGVGWRQCPVKVSDPTKCRYCLEHARKLGVDYYGPTETAEATARETAGNLTRLVPKAVATAEKVMDDEDAPAGIRLKAAAEVLDRTGYARGVDVRIEGQVNVIDVTAIINSRLDALRDAAIRAHPAGSSHGTGGAGGAGAGEIVDGELVPDDETPA
jgi:hypothetical protein